MGDFLVVFKTELEQGSLFSEREEKLACKALLIAARKYLIAKRHDYFGYQESLTLLGSLKSIVAILRI